MSDLVMAMMLMVRSVLVLDPAGGPPSVIELDPYTDKNGVICGGERHVFASDSLMMVSDGRHVLAACWVGFQ